MPGQVQTRRAAPRSIYAGIFLCSIGVLMLEILLTRIFSFTIWYHLAYLTISTALLGFGAAGSILAAWPKLVERDPAGFAARCAGGAGLALVVGLGILAPFPLSPHALLSSPGSFFAGLLFYYGVLTVPFALAGLAVAAPLSVFPAQVDRLYAADLFGAGLGCAGAVVALTWLGAPAAVFVCAAFLVAGGAAYAAGHRLGLQLGALAVALLAVSPLADQLLRFRPTETKAMGAALRQPGTELLFTRWSPINRVDLYRTAVPTASFWSLFGLSRGFRGQLPEVVSIQYDAHNGTDVYGVRGPHSLEFLDTHLLRAPYLLRERPRVLVIGIGGGIDVLNALRRGASHVTGVDLQPITIELHHGRLASWTGGELQRPEVELVAAEGRHYVRSHDARYDVLQITAVDTFSAQSTGAYVLAESYLYTVDAFADYLDHIEDDGVVSIVIGDLVQPQAEVASPLATRLALIARQALARRGIGDAVSHIAMLAQVAVDPRRPGPAQSQGWIAADLLVKKRPFTPDQLARLRSFASENGFELRHAPDGSSDRVLANLLAARDGELGRLLEESAYALEPLDDDRPFFFHVLRWASLLRGPDTWWFFPGSSTGQLMLLIMLGQAVLLGGALIVLPLALGARRGLSGRGTLAFLLYFLGLGLGFLLIEISFVQKYVLILGYPTYSLSVTIFSLLVFAAAGSALSRRGWAAPRAFLLKLLAATLGLIAIELLLLPLVRERLLAAPLGARIAATVLLQLPLGVALGMYFPTGIELVRRHAPRLVPWAWAVNGVASVASSVLAVVLAMAIGFSGVTLVAAAAYALGTLALVRALPRLEQQP